MNCALLFFGERCELCDKRNEGLPEGIQKNRCDDCYASLLREDAGGNGYDAQTVDHAHLVALSQGGMGYQPIKRVLCRSCYKVDYSKANNGKECPL